MICLKFEKCLHFYFVRSTEHKYQHHQMPQWQCTCASMIKKLGCLHILTHKFLGVITENWLYIHGLQKWTKMTLCICWRTKAVKMDPQHREIKKFSSRLFHVHVILEVFYHAETSKFFGRNDLKIQNMKHDLCTIWSNSFRGIFVLIRNSPCSISRHT